jgi:hypothetical protein
MKKLNQYFNHLPAARQRQTVIVFAITFALLLTWAIRSNPFSIKSGYVPQHIGHYPGSLTKKEKP